MKICSLLPSGTEIVYALGLGDQLVGVTDLCDYPAQARKKRVVSRSLVDTSGLTSAEMEHSIMELTAEGRSPFEVDTEWMQRECPDLVLTQDSCYVCDVSADQVREAASIAQLLPRILVLSPKTLSEIFATIGEVGEAAGVGDRAAKLVAFLRSRVDAVVRTASEATSRPTVLSLEGIDPLVAGGHWIPEMKLLAGGRDEMFSPGCPALRLSWDQVLRNDPDLLLISPCSSGLVRSLREVGWLARQEGWWDLRSVRTRQVYVMDHVYFSRPGPRIVTGIEILAEIIHPDAFSGLIPENMVLKLDPSVGEGCPADELARHFLPYPTP